MNVAPWPNFNQDEINAVTAVLQSNAVNYWTGKICRLFETEYAEQLGIQHAIAVTNGTAAIELALASLGVGPGDEVLVPSRTFVATASAVAIRKATPVFAEIDPYSQNIDPFSLEFLLTSRTKALIVVHVGGWPCQMDKIVDFCRSHNILLIEDCSQAHGARFNDKNVGTFGDAGTFSFCQDKIMTTGGEGGMLVTNKEDVYERAWAYKDHGKSLQKLNSKKGDGTFRFVHDSIGTNMRMTEMQAAIGREQLKKLRYWIQQRKKNASLIREYLKHCPGFTLPQPSSEFDHSYYRLYGLVDETSLRAGWSRDRIIRVMLEKGFPISIGSCGEVYRESAFKNNTVCKRFPNAALAHRESIAFFVHPGLERDWLEDVCKEFHSIMSDAVAANQKKSVA